MQAAPPTAKALRQKNVLLRHLTVLFLGPLDTFGITVVQVNALVTRETGLGLVLPQVLPVSLDVQARVVAEQSLFCYELHLFFLLRHPHHPPPPLPTLRAVSRSALVNFIKGSVFLNCKAVAKNLAERGNFQNLHFLRYFTEVLKCVAAHGLQPPQVSKGTSMRRALHLCLETELKPWFLAVTNVLRLRNLQVMLLDYVAWVDGEGHGGLGFLVGGRRACSPCSTRTTRSWWRSSRRSSRSSRTATRSRRWSWRTPTGTSPPSSRRRCSGCSSCTGRG